MYGWGYLGMNLLKPLNQQTVKQKAARRMTILNQNKSASEYMIDVARLGRINGRQGETDFPTFVLRYDNRASTKDYYSGHMQI